MTRPAVSDARPVRVKAPVLVSKSVAEMPRSGVMPKPLGGAGRVRSSTQLTAWLPAAALPAGSSTPVALTVSVYKPSTDCGQLRPTSWNSVVETCWMSNRPSSRLVEPFPARVRVTFERSNVVGSIGSSNRTVTVGTTMFRGLVAIGSIDSRCGLSVSRTQVRSTAPVPAVLSWPTTPTAETVRS